MIDGTKVRALRRKRGLTLKELSGRIKVMSWQRIGQIETGGHDLKWSRGEALADALGVLMDDLRVRG